MESTLDYKTEEGKITPLGSVSSHQAQDAKHLNKPEGDVHMFRKRIHHDVLKGERASITGRLE